MGTYEGVENDPDINKFTQSDIQDLTESGIGEGLRSAVVWIGLIVLVIVIGFLIARSKKAIKGKQ